MLTVGLSLWALYCSVLICQKTKFLWMWNWVPKGMHKMHNLGQIGICPAFELQVKCHLYMIWKNETKAYSLGSQLFSKEAGPHVHVEPSRIASGWVRLGLRSLAWVWTFVIRFVTVSSTIFSIAAHLIEWIWVPKRDFKSSIPASSFNTTKHPSNPLRILFRSLRVYIVQKII